jgi:hypothetical protein
MLFICAHGHPLLGFRRGADLSLSSFAREPAGMAIRRCWPVRRRLAPGTAA